MDSDKDITLGCTWCKKDFVFSVKDQKYYNSKSFDAPKKCKECRDKKKQMFAEKKVLREVKY